MTARPVTRHRLAAAALACAVVLAGCGPASAGLDADTARGLQSTAAEVRQAAGGGDFASALALLDRLSADVERSAREGRIGAERRARIAEAIALVRADVQAALDAAQAPAAPGPPPSQPEPGPKPHDQKGGQDKGGGKGQGKD